MFPNAKKKRTTVLSSYKRKCLHIRSEWYYNVAEINDEKWENVIWFVWHSRRNKTQNYRSLKQSSMHGDSIAYLVRVQIFSTPSFLKKSLYKLRSNDNNVCFIRFWSFGHLAIIIVHRRSNKCTYLMPKQAIQKYLLLVKLADSCLVDAEIIVDAKLNVNLIWLENISRCL